jgi:hypothetical protein
MRELHLPTHETPKARAVAYPDVPIRLVGAPSPSSIGLVIRREGEAMPIRVHFGLSHEM